MHIIAILSIFTAFTFGNTGQLAWVSAPVISGSWCSLGNLRVFSTCEEHYRQFPYAQDAEKLLCPRVHQLLFNELVKIKDESEHEYLCELLNVFYLHKDKICRDIWFLKKDLIKLADLKDSKANLRAIPVPYTHNRRRSLGHILTLTWPWYDSITQQYYSAGTRFVREPKLDTQNSFGIRILNLKNSSLKTESNLNSPNVKADKEAAFSKMLSTTVTTAQVPKELALVHYPNNRKECVKLFLKILRKWVDRSEFVPYATGGCSFLYSCNDNNFELKPIEFSGRSENIWERKNFCFTPISGIECSSLIFRIAQIVGMPYFYKNTKTVASYLDILGKRDELKNGDLIWYPGHILVVSDIDQNKAIEAAGYNIGFGKLHEITLDRVFKDINSYADLVKNYRDKSPIYRLNSSGDIVKKFDKFLLLKLDSVWG